MPPKKVVLSGIRATGKLHVGNYLGAIRYFAELDADPAHDCFFFVANLHTLTTRADPDEMDRDLVGIILDFIAAGIDPERSIVFAQSSVPETSELTWLLMSLAGTGELERMPHWKEKKEEVEKGGRTASAGLLTYPVLMAADILGPKANLVPVGQDQHPHVELSREFARRFNKKYGELFPVPELLEGEGIRVPGLKGGKMGKSDPDATVLLADPPSEVVRKFRAADKPINDEVPVPRIHLEDPGNPAHCRIFSFHQLVSPPEQVSWAQEGCTSASISCDECKRAVASNVNDMLAPMQERRKKLEAGGEDYVREILHDGGQRARKRIAPTVEEAKARMGVRTY